MSVLDKKSKLLQRQAELTTEIKSIRDEIYILRCLEDKAEAEISDINSKLENLH